MTYRESLRVAWFVAWRHSAFWGLVFLVFLAVLLAALSFPTSEVLREEEKSVPGIGNSVFIPVEG